jgi:uncharacterized protein YPO0396
MNDYKAVRILRDFAMNDIKNLDKCVREFTGDILDTEKRIKALNRAADFLDRADISTNKLNKTLNYLEDIKEDYKLFKDEFFVQTKHIKKALNTAMDRIFEELKDRDYDDYPFPM